MHNLRLRFDYDNFTLALLDEGQSHAFRRVFGLGDCATDSGTSSTEKGCSIAVVEHNGIYTVTATDELMFEARSFPEAAYYVMRIISDSFCSHVSKSRMVMHATTVSLANGTILFSGPSGSGKTSMALAFSRYGGFAGDECAYIDVESAKVKHENFPFQLKVRNERMLARFERQTMLKVHHDSIGEAYYVPLQQTNHYEQTRTWSPIKAIVFPRFVDFEGLFKIGKISPGKLPMLILGSLIGSSQPSRVLVDFVSMCSVHGIRIYEMDFSDAFVASDRLYDFLRKEGVA